MLISDLVYYGMSKHTELSKWWRTPSCKKAWARAIAKKKKKHAEWIAKVKAYRAAQQEEVNNWKVVS